MSLHIEYLCDKCDFNFLGGHSDCGGSNFHVFEFQAFCKSCLTSFSIFSEDLGYLQANQQCFLHPKSLFLEPRKYEKAQQRKWKRKIQQADKATRKQLKLEWENLEATETRNAMIEKVRSGTPIQVTELNGFVHLELATTHCPKCASIGKIILGFIPDEVCPKCTQGHMYCRL